MQRDAREQKGDTVVGSGYPVLSLLTSPKGLGLLEADVRSCVSNLSLWDDWATGKLLFWFCFLTLRKETLRRKGWRDKVKGEVWNIEKKGTERQSPCVHHSLALFVQHRSPWGPGCCLTDLSQQLLRAWGEILFLWIILVFCHSISCV